MSKFNIHYQKIKKIVLADLEENVNNSGDSKEQTKLEYHPFHMSKIQCYNPVYDIFFQMNDSNYDTISLNNKYHIFDLNTVIDTATGSLIKRDIFIKFAPLLDPIRFLIGKYKNKKEDLLILPSYNNTSIDKLGNPNNASYVDNFFCYLSSQLLHHHSCKNAIDYYGSFLGIQEKYKFNAADDIEYLVQSEHFVKNKGKTYEIEETHNPFANFGSRNNKNKICIHDNSNILLDENDIDGIIDMTDVTDMTDATDMTDVTDMIDETTHCIYDKNASDTDSTNSSNNSDINYSDDDEEEQDEQDDENEDDENEDEDDEDDEDEDDEDEGEGEGEGDDEEDEEQDEPQLNAFLYHFPVQMICLEKCKGTLDELFMKKQLDLPSSASALFQVIMNLIIYQKAFHFTHNDLHTNNIMFIETEEKYITYKYENAFYKVPTHGKIFKIIDYGRAIYKYQGKTFCSDSFAPDGDANTQYNFEPYFNKKKPRLDPNYSFDLCRLGCSIYDFILDVEDENEKDFMPDDLQRTIIRWITDDNGKNVLYMKNGNERYENFKLYKMIARTVHSHTPNAQLEDPFFHQFKMKMDEKKGKKGKKSIDVIDIDAIPCYANNQ